MIELITKGKKGRKASGSTSKEVLLSVIKSGLSASGKQRWTVSIRFRDGSYKKASSSEYVSFGYDPEINRLYFNTASKVDGYKLCGDNSENKYTAFAYSNANEWRQYEGEYDLVKDKQTGTYYIDLKSSFQF